MAKINADQGWQTLTHTLAKTTPSYLARLGHVRKAIRAQSKRFR